ncbi:MAG: PIN domain-containing protein [Stellaceae bacterium]
MNPPHFLDTNILLYSISRNPAEMTKRARAIELLEDDNGALSVQVLQEFYVQATRLSRAARISHEIAVRLIRTWSRFRIQEMTLSLLSGALEIKMISGFSYWDSAIVAAARALGCRVLYSEDMTHGQVVEGVTIINPFR